MPGAILGTVAFTSRTFVPFLSLIPFPAIFLLFGWLTVEVWGAFIAGRHLYNI